MARLTITLVCDFCGRTFERRRDNQHTKELLGRHGKDCAHCSNYCADRFHGRGTTIQLQCARCGCLFERRQAEQEARERRKGKQAVYCSNACRVQRPADPSIPHGPHVYCIEGPGNSIYIGATLDLTIRWGHHRLTLQKRKHRNPRLQALFDEHGLHALRFLVLAAVLDLAEMNSMEAWYIARAIAEGRNVLNVLPPPGYAGMPMLK